MNRFAGMFGRLSALAALFVLFTFNAEAASRHTGYLGITVEKLTLEDKKELGADFGVWVGDVAKDGPAEKAGIREDDVIRYYNGDKIRRPDDLTRRVREMKPGTRVKIGLVRDSKEIEMEVEIGRMRRANFEWRGLSGGEIRIKGRAGRFLGVRLETLNSDLAEYFKVRENEGALVAEVEDDSPAEKAGIKAGDVIVQIGDERVANPEDVSEILSDRDEGGKIEITLIRKGVKQKVEAELEERSFHFQSGDTNMHVHAPDCQVPDVHVQAPEIDVQVPNLDIQVELDENLKDKLKSDLEDLKFDLKNGLKGLENLKNLRHWDDWMWM